MKKFAVFLIIIVLIVIIISYVFFNYTKEQDNIKKANSFYEEYLNKEKTGTELATLINKAVDNNYKNEVEKDSKGQYINNEKNSINIDIKMIDNDETYNMEKIYYGKISTFNTYYRNILFKCTKIEYHSNGRIKYMFFEQITQ